MNQRTLARPPAAPGRRRLHASLAATAVGGLTWLVAHDASLSLAVASCVLAAYSVPTE